MTAFKIPISDLSIIKKLMPHREPMLMVDGLLAYDEGKATISFTVLNDNLFASNSEFSETGLIEHMAQAAALYTGFKNHKENQPAKEGFIASIKTLQIQSLPKVGDLITTQLTIIHEIMHMTTVKLSTFNHGVEIASAEMNTVLKEEK